MGTHLCLPNLIKLTVKVARSVEERSSTLELLGKEEQTLARVRNEIQGVVEDCEVLVT
jgi:hypothetical protein